MTLRQICRSVLKTEYSSSDSSRRGESLTWGTRPAARSGFGRGGERFGRAGVVAVGGLERVDDFALFARGVADLEEDRLEMRVLLWRVPERLNARLF